MCKARRGPVQGAGGRRRLYSVCHVCHLMLGPGAESRCVCWQADGPDEPVPVLPTGEACMLAATLRASAAYPVRPSLCKGCCPQPGMPKPDILAQGSTKLVAARSQQGDLPRPCRAFIYHPAEAQTTSWIWGDQYGGRQAWGA